MFGKPKSSNAITVIAGGSVVVGTLRVRGIVQVDGAVEGSLLVEGHVSVGPDGRISGDITADDLSVGGKVDGTVHARGHLHVLKSGSVCGETHYTTLEVDRGGVMDGRTSHVDVEGKRKADESHVEMIGDAAAE
jgi:cytoskeletal protein CcmA (bactofilin family)